MMLPLLVATLVQTIWIVDAANGPGTNFTNLPPAVSAAVSGDTIVVRAGNYAPFDVTGKALTILGSGASVTVLNLPTFTGLYQQAKIFGVPSGTTFYVSGIRFAPPPPGPAFSANGAIQVGGATTKVVLTDCVMQAGLVSPGNFGPPGMWVVDGAEVHASRCTFTGAPGAADQFGGGGGPGVWLHGIPGCVFVADACTFTGGARTGGIAGAGGGTGGAGLRVTRGAATLSRCSAYGGADVFGGPGAAGILVESFDSIPGFVRAAGTASDVFQGGATTSALPGNPAIRANTGASAIAHGSITLLPGSPGGPVTMGPVTLGAVPLPYLSMTGTPTPAGDLLASQPVTATFEGFVPSAPAVLFVDLAPIYLAPGSPIVGAQLVPFPGAAMLDLTLDAAGMFQMSFVPLIDVPALVGVPFFAQFGVLAASGSVRLSNGLIRVVRS